MQCRQARHEPSKLARSTLSPLRPAWLCRTGETPRLNSLRHPDAKIAQRWRIQIVLSLGGCTRQDTYA